MNIQIKKINMNIQNKKNDMNMLKVIRICYEIIKMLE